MQTPFSCPPVQTPAPIDAFGFAARGGELTGELLPAALPRLVDVLAADGDPGGLRWRLRGFLQPRAGQPPQALLRLEVHGALTLVCQRCLHPSAHEVAEAVNFRLQHGESALTQQELDEPDEVLPITGPLNVIELVEDQVLLALPIVPMHAVCPQPLVGGSAPSGEKDALAEDRRHPFAGLRQLLDAAQPDLRRKR